jgi:hypothetical protein
MEVKIFLVLVIEDDVMLAVFKWLSNKKDGIVEREDKCLVFSFIKLHKQQILESFQLDISFFVFCYYNEMLN